MTTATLTKGAAETLERDARGRIRLTAASERNISVQLTLFVLAALTVVTFARMGTARSTWSRPPVRPSPTSAP